MTRLTTFSPLIILGKAMNKQKLVIVESPAKCDTIKKYLGEEYQVMASKGHVRDLATSGKGGLGVDVNENFKPTYVLDKHKISTIKSLQSASRKADEVILATDPDREGEAIAWHLTQVLNIDPLTTKRLEFHEITRESITKAIQFPRVIDMNLVNSQETRRILDRIIGFTLSGLLSKKIHSTSAGRVQSATLKIIADHEKEINAFVPEEYYKFTIVASYKGKKYNLNLALGKDEIISSGEKAQKIIDDIPSTLKVVNIKTSERVKKPQDPFTTSTLQQTAYNKFKYTTKKTASIAQTLYEGLSIGSEHVGLITYMRTDSNRLSPTYINRAKNYIEERFGKDFISTSTRAIKAGQDAHEAIRPTGNHRTPESLQNVLTKEQFNLYKLIYERAVASLMKPRIEDLTTVTLEGNGVKFTIEGVKVKFPGYSALYEYEEDDTKNLPNLEIGESFEVVSKKAEQKFTQPPARYTEAKLVNIMEKEGIGRPSTYASTISILQKRKYVSDVGGVLQITNQGMITSDTLEKHFSDIVNLEYTAEMEKKLDTVGSGENTSTKILGDFYGPFMQEVAVAKEKMESVVNIVEGAYCPKCGAPLVRRQSKNGEFIGCSNFPNCKYIQKEPKEAPKETGELCPKCGRPLVERKDKKGRIFVACSGFPKCKYIKPDVEEIKKKAPKAVNEADVVKICPECGGNIIKKKGKYGYFLGCSNFPKCRHMEKIKK